MKLLKDAVRNPNFWAGLFVVLVLGAQAVTMLSR